MLGDGESVTNPTVLIGDIQNSKKKRNVNEKKKGLD